MLKRLQNKGVPRTILKLINLKHNHIDLLVVDCAQNQHDLGTPFYMSVYTIMCTYKCMSNVIFNSINKRWNSISKSNELSLIQDFGRCENVAHNESGKSHQLSAINCLSRKQHVLPSMHHCILWSQNVMTHL